MITLASINRPTRPEIPPQDWAEFLALPQDERTAILAVLAAIGEVSCAPRGSIMQACSEAASRLSRTGPGKRRWSRSTLYRQYRLFTQGGRKPGPDGRPAGLHFAAGDWRCLIREYGRTGAGLPEEFVRHLVSEWCRTTRGGDAFRSLCDRLYRDWLSGKPIPGYGCADVWYPRHGLPRPTGAFIRPADLPAGWGYRNLWRVLRKALPRQSQRRAAQGQLSRTATHYGAQLLRDRSHLLPLQLWTPDDVRLDLQALMHVDGRWQVVYVDALFALDVATGYVLGFGIKGMATRSDSTEPGRPAGTKMSIDSRDVRVLLLSVLERFGLPPWKSTLLCEGATAKLSSADELAFLQMLQGRLEIDYTGIGRGKLLDSGFAEDWGRPNLKGWIEAWFRKLHTTANALPGTTGRRYELTRGDQAERVKYALDVIRRAEKRVQGPLSPDHPLFSQLALPVLTVDEVHRVLSEMVEALNHRIDHRLQGFERIFEYRDPSSGLWTPTTALARMDPHERAGLECVPRMESPAERLRRLVHPHTAEFQRLSPECLSVLYAEKRLATARGGRVTVQCHKLGADRMTFVADNARVLDPYEGREKAVLAALPDDFSRCVLYDAATGAHIATLSRETRVDLLDREQLGRRAGAVRREMSAELDFIRIMAPAQELELNQMRVHNDRVVADVAGTYMPPAATAFAQAQSQSRVDKARRASARAQVARDTAGESFSVEAFAALTSPEADSEDPMGQIFLTTKDPYA